MTRARYCGWRFGGGIMPMQRNILRKRVLGLPGERRVERDRPHSQAS
jgi:hypothetical protein